MVRRDRRGVVLLIGGCAALVPCGCVMGPTYLAASRMSYNEVIQRTTAEQLLLNLVRLKYREAPVFLDVGSVSAQFVFDQSADIVGTLNENIPMMSLNPDVLRIGGGIGYQERPTITYTPLKGKEFVNNLLSPLPLKTVLLLARTGWRCVGSWTREQNEDAHGAGPDPRGVRSASVVALPTQGGVGASRLCHRCARGVFRESSVDDPLQPGADARRADVLSRRPVVGIRLWF